MSRILTDCGRFTSKSKSLLENDDGLNEKNI